MLNIKGTGSKNEIKIENGSSRLSAAEIEKMIQEANAEAEKDKTERERIESRNELDNFVYQKNFELENAELPAEEQEAANLAIEETRNWLDANRYWASKEQFEEQRRNWRTDFFGQNLRKLIIETNFEKVNEICFKSGPVCMSRSLLSIFLYIFRIK